MLKVTQEVLKSIKKQASWWMSTGHQGNQAFSCIYDAPFGERSCFALMTTVARISTPSEPSVRDQTWTARLQEKGGRCRCWSRGVSDCQTVQFLNWGASLCSIIAWPLSTQSSMKLYIIPHQTLPLLLLHYIMKTAKPNIHEWSYL